MENLAKRRSFSERVLGSDAFAALSYEVQALYFHLSMASDDEGMVGSPQRLARSIGVTGEALAALALAGLIIRFESGVCAITHFHENNYIHASRRRETAYPAERAALDLTEEGTYVLRRAAEAADTGDACEVHAKGMCVQSADPAPLPSPPVSPSSFSPDTPLSITPYTPPQPSLPPYSSGSDIRAACESAAKTYWGRALRRREREVLLGLIQKQAAPTREDRDELLDIAFRASVNAGCFNLAYLSGVYGNWEARGIRTVAAYADAEFARDKARGMI